jgi:hypothetical protein
MILEIIAPTYLVSFLTKHHNNNPLIGDQDNWATGPVARLILFNLLGDQALWMLSFTTYGLVGCF